MSRRAFCAERSRENAEPLAATASRVDRWILIEYRGLWGRDAVDSSSLSGAVKTHLRARQRALKPAKILFVRRSDRRHGGGLTVFWGSSREREARLSRAELASYDDLLDLGFDGPGEPVAHPLLLVCTHGKHDRCCARHGRPLFEALREQVDEDWVWQASHVGGDRFAGNLVCLPEGLYFGRVEPRDVWPVLDEYLAGRVHLPNYRGRSCYSFAVQAAERAVREHAALTGIDDVTLLGVDPIRFCGAGRVFELEVVAEPGEPTYLTCDAESLTHPRHYAARSLRGSAA